MEPITLALEILVSNEVQLIMHDANQNLTFCCDMATFFKGNQPDTIVGVAFQPGRKPEVMTIIYKSTLHTLLLGAIAQQQVLS